VDSSSARGPASAPRSPAPASARSPVLPAAGPPPGFEAAARPAADDSADAAAEAVAALKVRAPAFLLPADPSSDSAQRSGRPAALAHDRPPPLPLPLPPTPAPAPTLELPCRPCPQVSPEALPDEPEAPPPAERLLEESAGEIKTITAGDTMYASAKTFEELGLSAELLQGLYSEMKFERPSRIQVCTRSWAGGGRVGTEWRGASLRHAAGTPAGRRRPAPPLQRAALRAAMPARSADPSRLTAPCPAAAHDPAPPSPPAPRPRRCP
jgi:hypothetical protein